MNVDRLCETTEAAWRLAVSTRRITDVRGAEVPLDELGAIWWRRHLAEQKLDGASADEAHLDLINRDWRAFFKGLLLTSHQGMWISRPAATERASIKLWQLQKSAECGLRVPRTLASNDPAEVRRFLIGLEGPAIVKPITGTRLKPLFTQVIDVARLDDDLVRVVPAFYQELIPGDIHLRLNVFGTSVYAASITTPDIDWRRDLNVPVSKHSVDPTLERVLLHTLRAMDLEMGIVDMKLLSSGEPVWLEVNPQGAVLVFGEPVRSGPAAPFRRVPNRERRLRYDRSHRRNRCSELTGPSLRAWPLRDGQPSTHQHHQLTVPGTRKGECRARKKRKVKV